MAAASKPRRRRRGGLSSMKHTVRNRPNAGVVLDGDDDDGQEREQQKKRKRSAYRAKPTLGTLRKLSSLANGYEGYKKIDYELVEYLAGNGLTQGEIAEALGISQLTVGDKLHGHHKNADKSYREPDPKFKQAYENGKAQMRHVISNGLFDKAKRGDLSSLIFLAKTRMKWRETEDARAAFNPADTAALLREELAKASA